MRPTFALDLDLRPISVNAPVAQPHVLRAGDMFFLACDYQTEYGIVPNGTKLFVRYVDEVDGTTWLLAEGDVPALYHWDNELAIVPYDTEDLLLCLRAALRCPAAAELVPNMDGEGSPLPASNVRPMLKLLAAVALFAGLFTPAQLTHGRAQLRHSTQQAVDVEPLAPALLIRADATG